LPSRRRQSAIALVTDFSKPIIRRGERLRDRIGCIVTYCCDMIVASESAEWRLPQAGWGSSRRRAAHSSGAMDWESQAMRAAFGFPMHADERSGLASRNGWCRRLN